MAVTAREQAIIDRYEAGATVEAIAAELGMSRTYVGNRVSDLCTSLAGDGGARGKMTAGSRKLLARITEARAN